MASASSDTIPLAAGQADVGCVDAPGTLHADASAWYPVGDGGLRLSGDDQIAVTAVDPFQSAATAAVASLDPSFLWLEGTEIHLVQGSCVTHRYATFERGRERIVVAAWRVEGRANPVDVRSDGQWEVRDGRTLVSTGLLVDVVLLVAPDGTTVRVSSYGADADRAMAGWPSTVPETWDIGPPPYSVDELIPVAAQVLDDLLTTRGDAGDGATTATYDRIEPPEGSFVEGDAPITPIGENPLSGATEMPSWEAFFAAAQKAAADAGLTVAVVDPRPALGPMMIWFTGAAAAFVTPDATVVESLGASGAPYLDNLVTQANELPRTPGLAARRIADDDLDCAYLPGPDQDELLCGAWGTAVEFHVRHSTTSAAEVEQMARVTMPAVTWLSQSPTPTPTP